LTDEELTVSKLRFKTERASTADENFKRTQVDMPPSMISALDRICKQKCIHKRAELIRMYLAEAIQREEKRNESTKGGVGSRPNESGRRARRAG
jgi:hypothetical protein